MAALVTAHAATDIAPTTRLTIDLDQPIVIVDTTYDGAELLAFGVAPDRSQAELIVLITGPRIDAHLKTKSRQAGLWIERLSDTYRSLPGYFLLASTKPVEAILGPEIIEAYGLSLDSFSFAESISPERIAVLRRLLARERLYNVNSSNLLTFKNNLFRLPISLPSQAPTGVYTISVFTVSDKSIVQQATTSLWVRKEGLDAFVSETARSHPVIYGVVWSFISICAGLGMFLVFNYRRLK